MPTHHHHRRHADPPPISVPPKPNQKLLSLLLKSIIMGLIISLFLLFLGVAAIAFLHFLLMGSFLHRRRRHHSSSSLTTTSSAFSLDQLQTHLPPFKYNNSGFITSKDCSICLECFKEGEICRTLPVCGHIFHAGCVDQWLTRMPNCPVCRSQVRLNTGGTSDSSISDDNDFKLFWTFGV